MALAFENKTKIGVRKDPNNDGGKKRDKSKNASKL